MIAESEYRTLYRDNKWIVVKSDSGSVLLLNPQKIQMEGMPAGILLKMAVFLAEEKAMDVVVAADKEVEVVVAVDMVVLGATTQPDVTNM